MEQIHLKRLQRLYNRAIEIARDAARLKHFNLGDWVGDVDGWALDKDSAAVAVKEDGCVEIRQWDCGTTACMIGWAAQMPEFNAEGFCLATPYDRAVVPYYHATGASNWSAVEDFFGLTEQQALHLFYQYEYPPNLRTDPLVVAKRIRELIGRETVAA